MGELLAVASALFYGLSGVMARRGTDQLPWDQGVLISLLVNVCLLLPVSLATRFFGGDRQIPVLAVAYFAASGLLGPLLGRICAVGAVSRLGPSRASIYKSSQPLLTTAIALTLMGETFSAGALVGGLLVMAGVFCMSGEPRPTTAAHQWEGPPAARITGIALGLGAACGYALANVMRKFGMSAWSAPVPGTTIGALSGMCGLACMPGAGRRWQGLWRNWHTGHWSFAFFGLCTAVAQVCFFLSLRYTPVWVATLLVSTEPLMTVALSFIVFNGKERISRWLLASAALIVSGMAMLVLF